MRRRVLICLGLLFLVCLLGDVVAMLCLQRSITRLQGLAESHRIQSLRANLASSGVRVQTDLVSFLAGHEHSAEERAENVERFTRSLRRCGACHHPPHLKARLDGVQESFDAYQIAVTRFYASQDEEEALALRQGAIKLADRFVEQTTDMADLADRHLVASDTDVSASIRNAWRVLTGTLLALLVGGGMVAFYLKGRLTEPVEALLEGVERARRGDRDYRFPVHTDPEFRILAGAFNQAYDDLSSAQESILQAEKLAATGKFAAGVAHEVLNPLASISSIAQVMRRGSASEEQRSHLDLIMAEIERISKVLRELLAFSRPPAAENRTLVDIGPLLEHVATLIGYDRRARQIDIIHRLDPDLPPVFGDEQRLLLVFTNIMINAVDAMSTLDDGIGTLTISTSRKGQRVEVEFADRGPGMTQEQIAQAFEPFFTTKEPGAGTGLGLWICYQVVQRHKGTIRIASRTGEGTTVTIELPTEPEEGED